MERNDGVATDESQVPFLFVADDEARSADWLTAHPDWIRMPATFVPRISSARSLGRLTSTVQPVSGYGPGERAPEQGVPGTQPAVVDLGIAARAYMATDAYLRSVTGGKPTPSPSPGDISAQAAQEHNPARAGSATNRKLGAADVADNPTAPVPLLDDLGRIVLDRAGSPIQRPAGLDPQKFIMAGLRDKGRLTQALAIPDDGSAAFAALLQEFLDLYKFDRGGPWDAQRIGGTFHREFVAYATVAIGLYAAAAGLSRQEILRIQNIVARLGSQYPRGTIFDEHYKSLPVDNVWNTDLGYDLLNSGRIQPSISP